MATPTIHPARAVRILFITGVSGGGKGTALRALEDAGWFCIDNLPVPVVPRLIESFASAPEVDKLALVIDARDRRNIREAPGAIETARKSGEVQVLFLDAADDVLIRRFSETRRRHPLSPDGTVEEGIAAERRLLDELRAMADDVIDTSTTTVHELKALIQERFGEGTGDALPVTVTSFGYKHGVPPQADLVLDVRFLPNPYFVPALKERPGTDPEVATWVLAKPDARAFLDHALSLLEFLLPRYRVERKAYLTVALGCTGGRHRSVALAEALGAELTKRGIPVRVRHRDVARGP